MEIRVEATNGTSPPSPSGNRQPKDDHKVVDHVSVGRDAEPPRRIERTEKNACKETIEENGEIEHFAIRAGEMER